MTYKDGVYALYSVYSARGYFLVVKSTRILRSWSRRNASFFSPRHWRTSHRAFPLICFSSRAWWWRHVRLSFAVFVIVSHKNSIAWNSSNLQPSVGGEKWIYDFSHLAFGWTILLSVSSISWTPESDNNNPPTEREAHAAHVACVTQPGMTLRLGYTQTPHWLQTPSITKTEAKLLLINACRPAYVHIWVVSFNCQFMRSSPIGHRCAGGVAGFVFVCSPVDIFQI